MANGPTRRNEVNVMVDVVVLGAAVAVAVVADGVAAGGLGGRG